MSQKTLTAKLRRTLALLLTLTLLATLGVPSFLTAANPVTAAPINPEQPIALNGLPPFPEDATRPPTDWSQTDWDQEVTLIQAERAYRKQLEKLLAEDRLEEAKALEKPAKKFSDDEVMAHYQVPPAVQELVQAYRTEQTTQTKPNSLLRFFAPQKTAPAKRKENLAAEIKALLEAQNYFETKSSDSHQIEPQKYTSLKVAENPNNEEPLEIIDIRTAPQPTIQNLQMAEPISADSIQIKIPETETDLKNQLRQEVTLKIPTAQKFFSYSSTTDPTPIIEYYAGIENHPIESLLYYLSSNQNADGSFGDFNQLALTGQIALSLNKYNKTNSAQFTKMVNYLKTYTPKNNREKALKARLMLGFNEPYQALLDDLLAQQNSENGGFPLFPNYQSDLETTLEAIWAFWAADQIDNLTIKGGLSYVFTQIQPDGSLAFFPGGEPSYYLINKTLAYLKLFEDLSLGTTPATTVTVQSKIDRLLNFLNRHYDAETQTLADSNSITDALMTLRSFELYDFAKEKQELLFENASQKQHFNGSFGDSFYATVAAMQALPQPDLIITKIETASNLINQAIVNLKVTIQNKGYANAKNIHLYNFFDNFQLNDGYDLSAMGLTLKPQEEIVLALELSKNITQRLIGETEIKFYLESENELDYTNNWFAQNFTFTSNANNKPALPTYYIATQHDISGAPALNIRWAEKADPNRRQYIVILRQLGTSKWNFIGISNDRNGGFLTGFTEGMTYEITAGVLHKNGSTLNYFPKITQVKMTGDKNLYTGNVTGFVTENNKPLANIHTWGYGLSDVTDSEGNFSYANAANGKSVVGVDQRQYEEIRTQFEIPTDSSTTENVRLFTRLKPDKTPPTIKSLQLRFTDNFKLKNQREWGLFVQSEDNVKVKEADFYYYNPAEDFWFYLGTKNFTNSNRLIFDWYIPANLVGNNYKIKTVVWDYQGNPSAPAEWGPFEILEGTEPSGLVEVQNLTENTWSLGETKAITWQITAANPLEKISGIELSSGSRFTTIARNIELTKTNLTYTMPLEARYVTEQAYLQITACDTNANCAQIKSPTFSIVDKTPAPQKPWGAPQEVGFSLTDSNYLDRYIAGIFQNADGSIEIIYKEYEGHSGSGYSWYGDNATNPGQLRKIVYRKLINNQWQDPVVLKQHAYFTFYDKKTENIRFWLKRPVKDSKGDIHLLYEKQRDNSGTYNDNEIHYLKINNGSKVLDNQIRAAPTCVYKYNLKVNEQGKIFIFWLEGRNCDNFTGSATLHYVEGNGTNSWTSVTKLNNEYTYNHDLIIENNAPVIAYRIRKEIGGQTTRPLILSKQQDNNWLKVTLLADMTDLFWNPHLFQQTNNIYDLFYTSRSGATNRKYQAYFQRFEVDFSAATSTTVTSQALLKLTATEEVRELNVLQNTGKNYHVFYNKDKGGPKSTHHLFFDGTKTYFDTWVSSPIVGTSDIIGLENKNVLTVYFIGSLAKETFLFNTANYNPLINYRLNSITPANEATLTSLNAELKWKIQNGEIETYAVLLGLSSIDLDPIATGLTAPNFTTRELLPKTTYYWQVIGHNQGQTIPSNVWRFKTGTGNVVPAIEITEPEGATDTAETAYVITWTDADPDSDAKISLYYDTDNSGADGTLIVENLREDSATDAYTWNISTIPEGTYYIYAVIDDRINDPVTAYSAGALTIDRNEAPDAQNQSVETAEDTALELTLSAQDPDGDSLTYTIIQNPSQGRLSGTAPNLTYTPNSNYHGPDTITFKANDGTVDSNPATVTISVTQQRDYRFTMTNFNWQDISSTGTALSLSDDSSSQVNLLFSFPFYGQTKNTIKISSNGYLSFGNNATSYSNTAIPNSSAPNDLIAPFWDDLNPSSGGTVYYYNDTANNRFIVQYDSVFRYGTSTPETFQIILTPNGKILFQYQNLQGTLNSATVGIENATGTAGLQIAYNKNYLTNNLAVLIEQD